IVHPADVAGFGVVRFVAPSSGSFVVTAGFLGRDQGQPAPTTDVHVLLNGTSLFDETISGFGPRSNKSFAATLPLTIGDTLDFVVGNGQNGHQNDSTSVAAVITAVPTPSPVVVGVTPSSGSGPSQTFSYLFSDLDGFNDITATLVIL